MHASRAPATSNLAIDAASARRLSIDQRQHRPAEERGEQERLDHPVQPAERRIDQPRRRQALQRMNVPQRRRYEAGVLELRIPEGGHQADRRDAGEADEPLTRRLARHQCVHGQPHDAEHEPQSVAQVEKRRRAAERRRVARRERFPAARRDQQPDREGDPTHGEAEEAPVDGVVEEERAGQDRGDGRAPAPRRQNVHRQGRHEGEEKDGNPTGVLGRENHPGGADEDVDEAVGSEPLDPVGRFGASKGFAEESDLCHVLWQVGDRRIAHHQEGQSDERAAENGDRHTGWGQDGLGHSTPRSKWRATCHPIRLGCFACNAPPDSVRSRSQRVVCVSRVARRCRNSVVLFFPSGPILGALRRPIVAAERWWWTERSCMHPRPVLWRAIGVRSSVGRGLSTAAPAVRSWRSSSSSSWPPSLPSRRRSTTASSPSPSTTPSFSTRRRCTS